ncbi:MAG: hypothetical protein HC808_12895, partial [Candidatus Competibacteraceae bacterium]|nr:hypothetical protein [Candidatus Competibacteraceae bacterium]
MTQRRLDRGERIRPDAAPEGDGSDADYAVATYLGLLPWTFFALMPAMVSALAGVGVRQTIRRRFETDGLRAGSAAGSGSRQRRG